jgi:hypothetical protein
MAVKDGLIFDTAKHLKQLFQVSFIDFDLKDKEQSAEEGSRCQMDMAQPQTDRCRQYALALELLVA